VCCHALDDCLQRYPATLDRRPLRIVRAIRGRRIDADRPAPSAIAPVVIPCVEFLLPSPAVGEQVSGW
jgi:hypothetical protein